ncbi:MAG: hypothetical protein WAM39_18520 [Bryobacteraceae bacterium]
MFEREISIQYGNQKESNEEGNEEGRKESNEEGHQKSREKEVDTATPAPAEKAPVTTEVDMGVSILRASRPC